MAQPLRFDEINRLGSLPYKPRSVPYEKYFGEMGIPESEKLNRISFAEGLEDKMMLIFALVEIYAQYGTITQQWLENEIERTYTEYAGQFFDVDEYVAKHIKEFSKNVAQSTLDNLPDDIKLLLFGAQNALYTEKNDTAALPIPPDTNEGEVDDRWMWYLSMDRATFIAENEANDMMEYEGYLDAIEAGMTQKKWCTVGDNRVRDAHADTEGQIVDIDEYFLVGGEYGLFPGDTEHLSAENTVNCRCWLEYS